MFAIAVNDRHSLRESAGGCEERGVQAVVRPFGRRGDALPGCQLFLGDVDGICSTVQPVGETPEHGGEHIGVNGAFADVPVDTQP